MSRLLKPRRGERFTKHGEELNLAQRCSCMHRLRQALHQSASHKNGARRLRLRTVRSRLHLKSQEGAFYLIAFAARAA